MLTPTPPDLAHLEKLLAEATTQDEILPWRYEVDGRDALIKSGTGSSIMGDPEYYPWMPSRESMMLIAAAVTALPWLLARVRELEAGDGCETCGHVRGWHRQNLGTCIECSCLEFQPRCVHAPR